MPTPSRAVDGWRNGLSVGVSVRNTVIPSHGRKGAVSRPQESGAVIPVYKGEVNTGLSVDRPVQRSL
ncbi:hypothetical protein [Bacteroides salyersiae]|uniref:hypothetical protein n=1 Tax=Bacteroides salyersiae TaxID=291644 RepID=UPI00030A6C2C|nr:hypothetical protein [Bacteroides salyersiae]MBV4202208.1 hypothetical protein [Bacteroides salyersiae]MBV4202415.1 hypothetical protein [Bacteroides salyersiae]MCB6649751.1 hypothetical protein [Bacteroides salyersiae]UBD18332.1 hypothetical protein K6V19_17515 [Bacteroides salyersiae]UBD67306.1 hypothetical protein K6V25_18405 [Bacteroides salyersiae]